MKRLLCILSGMNAGGAETFLMKIYRTIDKSEYQMDFCINVQEKCFYEDEILALGGRIFRIPEKSKNLKEFKQQLSSLVKNEHYEYVLRITSSAMGFMDLKIAKKAGAKVCCARSSNSSDGDGLKAKIAHKLGRFLYSRYVDVSIAPSDLAAAYTFGKNAYEKGKVSTLHNAVDLDVFRYNDTARNFIRKEFGISDSTTVIGHVGRFSNQKNHLFLADIFKSVKNLKSDSVLLLVGVGELKEDFERKISEIGIRDSVIFAGVRSDVPDLLSAIDVFVFPSFYEGMPNTVIEAQATGLPCIISNTITKEVAITELVEFCSLSDTADHWAETAVMKASKQRLDTKNKFIEEEYDIESVAKRFISLIFG